MSNVPENSQKTGFRGPSPDVGKETQWKPGQSGNPGGRPKRKWLTEVIDELLEEKLQDPEERARYKEQMWQKLLSNRVVGAMTLDKVWERTEGKVTQPIEHSVSTSLAEAIAAARKRAK